MANPSKLSASLRRQRVPAPTRIRSLQQRYLGTPSGSVRALCRRMGPFDAARHAFRFGNSFPLTETQSAQIRQHYRLAVDAATGVGVQAIRSAMNGASVVGVGIPAAVATAVAGEMTNKIAGPLIDKIVGAIPGNFGRCGGMAFAGYDFYLHDWPVDERLGTAPPATGVLGDYIFARLLDSLDLNVIKFLDWVMMLHVMPVVSEAANVALGVAMGAVVGGPLLALAGGALHPDIIHIGGPKTLLERTKDEWQKIKTTLDTQAAWPVGFVYGNSANPIDQHQVLATGYEDRGDGTGVIRIWDNNRPNEDLMLTLDFRGDELEVGNTGNAKPLKGFFREDYVPVLPPGSLHFA